MILFGAAGCSGDAREVDVAVVSQAFSAAVSAEQWASACTWLAPQVIEDLDQDGGCVAALPNVDLPDGPEGIVSTQVWGRAAQVQLDRDVLFLAEFPGGWRITAAGCTRREDLPYQCTIGS